MGRVSRALGVLIALALILGVPWALIQGAIWLAHKLLELPPALSVAIIAAVVAPIGSVTSLFVSKYFERRAAALQQIRERKTRAYESLLEVWALMFMGDKMGKGIAAPDGTGLTHEFATKMEATGRDLIVWGRADVLRDWSRIRRRMATGKYGDNWAKMVAEMEVLFRAIRSDLGLSNTKLEMGDVMGMYINDIPIPDDAVAQSKQKKRVADESGKRAEENNRMARAEQGQVEQEAEERQEPSADKGKR
jgi:hypothetical protein